MYKVPNRNIASVNFSHAMFPLLFTNNDLVMQALVWLCMVHMQI